MGNARVAFQNLRKKRGFPAGQCKNGKYMVKPTDPSWLTQKITVPCTWGGEGQFFETILSEKFPIKQKTISRKNDIREK